MPWGVPVALLRKMAIKHLRKDLIVLGRQPAETTHPAIADSKLSSSREPDADGPRKLSAHFIRIKFDIEAPEDPSPLRKASKCIYGLKSPRREPRCPPYPNLDQRQRLSHMDAFLDDGQEAAPVLCIRHFDTCKVQYHRRDIDVSVTASMR